LLGRRHEPLRLSAVRDLLGIVRVIYAIARERGARQAELDQLARIGRRLAQALELATSGTNTVGERAAWEHAEKACQELPRAIEPFLPAEEIVKVACRAVVGGAPGQPELRKKREER
jgi:hypothetical protein